MIDFEQGDPWENIAKAVNEWSGLYLAYDLLEANEAFFGCSHVKRGRAIVRYALETAKPEEERKDNFKGDELQARKNELLGGSGEAYDDIVMMKLSDSLSMLYELSRPVEGGRAL